MRRWGDRGIARLGDKGMRRWEEKKVGTSGHQHIRTSARGDWGMGDREMGR